MSEACTLSFEADDVFRALDGEEGDRERLDAELHLERCAACRAKVRARALAKATWRAALARDDAFARDPSERRLEARWPRPSARPVRTFALGFGAAAVAAAVLLAAHRPSAWLARRESGALAAVATAIGAEARAMPVATPPPPAERRAASSSGPLVVASACASCRLAGAPLAPGEKLSPGEKLEIPSGGHVTIGFALDGDLVDPHSGADVEGPAVASTGTDGTLHVDRGSTRVRAGSQRDEVTVVFPGGRVVAMGASYTLVVDERGGVRIAVTSGKVQVVHTATATDRMLGAGESTTLVPPATAEAQAPLAAPAPPPADVPPAAPPPSAAEAEAKLADARTRARGGDAAARAALETLASGDGPSARRAAFTLAELDLVAGNRAAAQARLVPLLGATWDAALAFDAATLFARSEPSPASRADAWARYLATAPRSPFRERAQLERAEALLDTGEPAKHADAEALVTTVQRSASLTDRESQQVERLRMKLRPR